MGAWRTSTRAQLITRYPFSIDTVVAIVIGRGDKNLPFPNQILCSFGKILVCGFLSQIIDGSSNSSLLQHIMFLLMQI